MGQRIQLEWVFSSGGRRSKSVMEHNSYIRKKGGLAARRGWTGDR